LSSKVHKRLTSTQGVVELLKHPEQLAELKANPSLAPDFVSELCRYHTASALAMKRVAKVDIELGGKVGWVAFCLLDGIH